MRKCAHIFPYLLDGWTDYAEIWCVARDPLTVFYSSSRGWGTSPRTFGARATPFLNIGNGSVLKFGMWLGAFYLCVLHKSWVVYICTCRPVFHTSKINGRIVLKLVVLLETH